MFQVSTIVDKLSFLFLIIMLLQKYQKFLQRVLEGRTNIEFSHWIDLNYRSSFVSGNPDILLINQLREEQKNGNLATHNPLRPPKEPNISTNVRAPNGSSTSKQYKQLPPYNKYGEIIILIYETIFLINQLSFNKV